MASKTDILNFASADNLKWNSLLGIVARFSIPAIMAQITSVVMQYIDAAMVGSLGANASASIGLVSTTTWLLNGLCIAAATGFSVQIAQLVGARRTEDARNVLKQALVIAMCFGLLLATVAFAICRDLPLWLGGDKAVIHDSSRYFMVYAFTLPATQLRQLCGGILQCSGDMKTPSKLNILMCFLNMFFNLLMIFPTRTVSLLGTSFTFYGAGMGVVGAALGTAMAEYATAFLMLFFLSVKSPILAFRHGGSWRIQPRCVKAAMKIFLPAALEHTIICGAYICSTLIIAPLGTVSVAAHSLAITAESFCYMPGYGIGNASTTLVGQTIGADRKDLARRFSYTAIFLGVSVMTITGALMYFVAPGMFSLLTPDKAVQSLGTTVLRIEAFAEPLYAASIVCVGILRGAGDTLVPSILNLASMWGVRIVLSFILVPHLGLCGAWIAMATELCVRGVLFLIRVHRGRWLEKKIDI